MKSILRKLLIIKKIKNVNIYLLFDLFLYEKILYVINKKTYLVFAN